ncbi:hypothetical protein Tco_1488892 [Tanacetum coccineum]
MLLMQAQENELVFDEDQLLFIAGGQTNTFDDDEDEAPVQDLALNEDHFFQPDQSDPIYDEASPSYDSDILSEVQDHDNYLDSVDEYQEVKNNVEQVVQSNVSSVQNDSLMMIINDMHNQAAQCVSTNEHNKVVNESLTVKLARYKEQVAIYEKGQVDEKKKVAIGYKNPLYLTSVMQVQSALYNGHEIVKTNHALTVVHDSEDTLELVEITRKRML